tara:strand:+ start:3201 stop:3332 length:132 start_codon:yes stop_codon:yes gene_type:complete
VAKEAKKVEGCTKYKVVPLNPQVLAYEQTLQNVILGLKVSIKV